MSLCGHKYVQWKDQRLGRNGLYPDPNDGILGRRTETLREGGRPHQTQDPLFNVPMLFSLTAGRNYDNHSLTGLLSELNEIRQGRIFRIAAAIGKLPIHVTCELETPHSVPPNNSGSLHKM